MRLYLSNTTDTTAAVQNGSLVEEPLEAVTLFGGQTLHCYLPLKPGYILSGGRFSLRLNFAATGSVTVTPSIILSDRMRDVNGNYVPNPNTPDQMWFPSATTTVQVSKATNATGVGTYLLWEDTVDYQGNIKDLDLTETVVILRLEVVNIAAGSSITIGSESRLNVPIVEGGYETLGLYRDIIFKIFEVRERMWLYSEVDVKEKVDRALYSQVNFLRDIELELWSEVYVNENIQIELEREITAHPIETLGNNWGGEIEIDNYSLRPDSELKGKKPLGEMIDHLLDIPPIYQPPSPVKGSISSLPSKGVAQQFVEVANMLLNEIDEDTPPGSVQVYKPGPLYGGTMVNRLNAYGGKEREWQLPSPYGSGDYLLQLPVQPNLPRARQLFAMFREREVGAFVHAYLQGVPGKLLLQEPISSWERVTVWMWDVPSTPFEVVIEANNPEGNMPGVAGTGAAVMKSI